jgi:hypothetical protein
MATQAKNGTEGADEKLVRVLEETAVNKILEKLDSVLPEIAKTAVAEAIVYAMHNDKVAIPKRESRSFAPKEARKPKEGGVCEAVWKELDRLKVKSKGVPKLADIQKVGDRKGWNPNNTRVEYYQWRKAQGISGRQSTPTEQPTAH